MPDVHHRLDSRPDCDRRGRSDLRPFQGQRGRLGLRLLQGLRGRLGLALLLLPLLGLGLVSCEKDEDSPLAPEPDTEGTMELVVTGLLESMDADIDITGPNSFQMAISESITLSDLEPGSYVLTAGAVSSATDGYTPTPTNQTVAIAAGETDSVEIAYEITGAPFGSISVEILGLPTKTDAVVQLDGPGGFQRNLTVSESFEQIAVGSYTVSAATVTTGNEEYEPTPVSQDLDVAGGDALTSQVQYVSTSTENYNVTIETMILAQATQRFDGKVPLVAQREALLRVFVIANEFQPLQPKVLISIYTAGGSLLEQSYAVAGPTTAPLATDEGDLGSTWNLNISSARIFPGVRILAEVDPDHDIAESDEFDNFYPSNGTPMSLDVRTEPELKVRFVAVHQSANLLIGDVDNSNKDVFVSTASVLYPVSSTSTTLRPSAYTTSTPGPLEADNGNEAWEKVLFEIQALRVAESVATATNFYGVVKTGYTSGVAGVGHVPSNPSRAVSAIGWDHLPSGRSVAAHELGHNFGRKHAPCGSPLPAGIDPDFPYVGGKIGAYGYDLATGNLYSPDIYTDLMGYCAKQWVSDYTYEGVRSFRMNLPAKTENPVGEFGPGLLVWGHVGPDGLVLEPAFELTALAALPDRAGSHALEARGVNGESLWRISFTPLPVADLPGVEAAGFAFVVPNSMGKTGDVTSLQLTGPGGSSSRESQFALGKATGEPAYNARNLSAERFELRWNATEYPMVMVTDATSGEILSFARGGAVRIYSSSREIELSFSDGVVSHRARASVE